VEERVEAIPVLPIFPERPLSAVPNVFINRGSSACLLPNAKEEVEVVDMKARCTVGEVIAVVFGVQWGQAPNGVQPGACFPYPGEAIALIRARLRWSLGRNTYSAEVDVVHGGVLFVPADNITVYGRLLALAPPGADYAVAPQPVVLSAGFAEGSGAVREAAQLTEIVALPAPVDGMAAPFQDVPIPSYAKGFRLMPNASPGGATATLQAEIVNGGTAPYPLVEATAPLSSMTTFSIPNGARCLRVSSPDGVARYGSVVFYLDL